MSTSSEIVDSGVFSGHYMPEKSNFSQTCNLLSQYLRDKPVFGDLTLGMAESSTATMNLFPVAEKSATASLAAASPVCSQQVPKKQHESAQMTIFYAGQVIVFNDFSAEKAKEIMMLAGKGTSQKPKPVSAAAEPSNFVASSPNLVPNFNKNVVKEHLQLQRPQPMVSDLPIARKASLARFLEKRKDRITARAPYPGGNSGASATPSTQDDGKVWLGLAAEQFQPHS